MEFLQGWCKGDVDVSVRHMMRALLSTDVAEQLSLTGRNGKAAFIGTRLYDAVLGKYAAGEDDF